MGGGILERERERERENAEKAVAPEKRSSVRRSSRPPSRPQCWWLRARARK